MLFSAPNIVIQQQFALHQKFNIALQARWEIEDWERYFIKAGISADSTKSYTATFAREKLTKDNLQMMNQALVAQKSNPMVHRITFASMLQHEDELIQQYLVRLRATATDCNFSLSDIYIKDQFIRRIANDALQTDQLAKAGVQRSLDLNVCHAEAFESALRDQTAMTDTSDVATIWMSTYRRQKNSAARTNRGNIDPSTPATRNNNFAEQ